MNLYPAHVRHHSISSPHRGTLTNYTISYRVQNQACGDVVVVQGLIDESGVLQAMQFSGEGCMLSQAAISLLIEKTHLMPVADIFKISCCDMRDMIAMDLGPTRLRCVLMALTAMHKALEQGGYHYDRSGSNYSYHCSIHTGRYSSLS